MTERIVEGVEFREGIQRGINKLAGPVRDTLGPLGNTVIIKNAFGEITVTKDGVSVANEIELEDPLENMGAQLVKEVASKANTLAGDGTTTATVLAQAIYNEGIKQLALGNKPLDFKRGLKSSSIDVLKYLEGKKKLVTVDSPELYSVAMVSSNGDEEIAKTIVDIYKELGINAVISTVQGDGIETTMNIVKGMQFDRGYLSPYCINDKIKGKADFENPLIFLYDGKISDFKTIFPAVEYAGSKNRPLIIVAENVQESALRGLVINHATGNVTSAVVMSPGYGSKRTERLHDMAALFGGQVFDENSKVEDFDPDFLGEAVKAEITSTDTAFIGGRGDQETLDARIEFIEAKLEHHKGNKYERDILQERLGKLSSGVAMIKVGALSTEEGKELLDRVEDCKFAVKAALSEGIIDGGGMALYDASEFLNLKTLREEVPESVVAGYKALLQAIKVPFKQIIINAGEIPEVIESVIKSKKSCNGYDVKERQYVNSMMKSGITDPFKVMRIALESSVSIVGTLLTSNYAIISKDDTTTTTFR